jgi:hypothetical protein
MPYSPPPAGAIDPGVFEDSYIAFFNAKDSRAARVFYFAEHLYNAGKLTLNSIALYANDVLSSDFVADAVQRCFSASFAASLLGNSNLSISKVAQILTSRPLSILKAIDVVTLMDLTAVKNALSNMSADDAQSILYACVDKGAYPFILRLLTFDALDSTISSNTTLTAGVNRYRNLTVNSGVTLTLGASPGVILADELVNYGTISSGWVKGAGGAAGASGCGAGGNGAGGIILLARSIGLGTVMANGANGGNGSTVAANAAGGAGGAGAFWCALDTPVKGGDGGSGYGTEGKGVGNPNGGGGGGYAAATKGGDGGSASTVLYPSGRALLSELLKAACDWWLINVLGKNPTSTKSLPSLGGSGGGGGGCADTYCAGGGGGGGGGQIIVFGTSLNGGTLYAAAGNGGSGGTEGSSDAGGGGGGGGVIYVFYQSLSGSNIYSMSNGSGGGGDRAGVAGSVGIYREFIV